MKCEMRQCQVRIDCDVADVIMISTVEDGKVKSLEMRIFDFLLNDNGIVK